jgi:hypothetical protein
MFVLSTDDYFKVADDALLDFGAAESFTLFAVARPVDATPAAYGGLVMKTNVASAGYGLYHQTNGEIYGLIHDGTLLPFDTKTQGGDNVREVYAMRRDVGADEIETFIDGVGSGSPTTDTTTATLENASDLYIGSNNAPDKYYEGSIVAVALFREALTDDEIAAVGNALILDKAGAQGLHDDALFGWILANDPNAAGYTPTEYVGLLNDLNGTSGVEEEQARDTYLSS